MYAPSHSSAWACINGLNDEECMIIAEHSFIVTCITGSWDDTCSRKSRRSCRASCACASSSTCWWGPPPPVLTASLQPRYEDVRRNRHVREMFWHHSIAGKDIVSKQLSLLCGRQVGLGIERESTNNYRLKERVYLSSENSYQPSFSSHQWFIYQGTSGSR